MIAVDAGLQDLRCRHPEWEPWLKVIGETLCESADSRWEAVVPRGPGIHTDKLPLLAEAHIRLDNDLLRAWFERLIRVAYAGGTGELATLKTALSAELEMASLFKYSLQQRGQVIEQIAETLSTDAAAFQAVAALIPVPFLQACNRAWVSSTPASWTEGYCPVCGSWPAFAEMRGIERSRYLRCGRCGGEWLAQVLLCPYCGNKDHERQVSLVAENGAKLAIEACKSCLGYVKTFSVLQGSPSGKVIVEDLSSVEMDLAAAEQGYRRPEGTGFFLDVTVSELRRQNFS
jgi:FdhE protein